MQPDYTLASAYVSALGGGVFDWRAIHDKRTDLPAHTTRGTLEDCWQWLCSYNALGYGIFAAVNVLDGRGRDLANVASIRAHFIDLDNLSAMQNLQRAAAWSPLPAFAVMSSPNKAHVYWPVSPYAGNDRFTLIQRKLIALFDGDKRIHDATRVMRIPGFFHQKGEPVLTTCFALPGIGAALTAEALEAALGGVAVVDGAHGRTALGDAALAAPGLDWIAYALNSCDPNTLDRGDWIALTAAIKQAGWSLTDERTLFDMWSQWCSRYATNNPVENLKQWNSIRNSELGWPAIVRRVPAVHAAWYLGNSQTQPGGSQASATAQIMNNPGAVHQAEIPAGEIMTDQDQRQIFAGCTFVVKFGEILAPNGRLLNPGQFNGLFGGKKYIIDQQGKITNEAWQAATRSTLWTIPKADHLRFVPIRKPGEMIEDSLGRLGVNTYIPARIKTMRGDPSPFLEHLRLMIPNDDDRKTLLDFIAHNARFPGYKIPWAPLVQSAEGVGKGVLKQVISHVMGDIYVHFPNAQELVESGSKFNAWMRAKLFILVDEIKVDERRDMIEVLKPMISEKEIEIQGKGHDQDKEDNYSNWAFFSNYKDAIPVSKNARRFCVFYSAIQSLSDLKRAGMNDQYFSKLYGWLEKDGCKIVADYLLNYPIKCGEIPMRAPDTTSTVEAQKQSRGSIEQMISDAVDDGLPGFKNGWISATAVMQRAKMQGGRMPSLRAVQNSIEALGYYEIGRSIRAYFQEDVNSRSLLYSTQKRADVAAYARAQGYE